MEPPVICIECLRCHHRGILDREALIRHGASETVSLVTLSRIVVCQACGSRTTRMFRADLDEARTFLENA